MTLGRILSIIERVNACKSETEVEAVYDSFTAEEKIYAEDLHRCFVAAKHRKNIKRGDPEC